MIIDPAVKNNALKCSANHCQDLPFGLYSVIPAAEGLDNNSAMAKEYHFKRE
jgi:hypothetical protein